MDTRTKIVPLAEAVERTHRDGLAVVTACLDPLLPAHAERLTGLGPLLLVVADPRQPLLSTSARAELAAALRSVRIVVAAGSSVEQALAVLPAPALRLEAEESAWADALAAHIRERHALALPHEPAVVR